MDFVNSIYDATEDFPRSETYRLVDQLRRAAVSVPANIAEGQGRRGPKEFCHHLSIAYGSLAESETLLMIAAQRGFLDQDVLENLLDVSDEIGRLLQALLLKLRQSADSPASVRRTPSV
jgi:four helix bundle protein